METPRIRKNPLRNTSRRHNPLPPGWYKTRLRILKRDGYQCTHIRQDSTGGRCPEKATDVDHIDPLGPDTDDNLRSLCGYHHHLKSSSEGGSSVHKKSNKPRPKHPGMMRVCALIGNAAKGSVGVATGIQKYVRVSMYANAC